MGLKRYEMSGKESIYSIINFFTAYLTINLYEEIDEDALLSAVKVAIVYHPLFGMRIGFENGLFYFEENPDPPLVFRSDNAPKKYGTLLNNHYPWMFVIEGKKLVFYTMHYVTDGLGMFNFCKTVLHIYFQLKGVVFSDGKTDFPDGAPEQTMENPIEKYADKNCVGVGTPKFDLPVLLSHNVIQPGNAKSWMLKIQFPEIRALAKQSETSVFSVISCILSRAMAKAYGIESGNIDVRVPVNFRGIFPSITDRNFVQGFSLCYMADRMNNMSDALVETAFRSQLDLWMEKGNLTEILNRDVETAERLKKDSGELQAILDFEQTTEPRANILYTHITRPGFSDELMEHIAGMYLAANDIQDDYVNVFGTTVGTDICLTIQQCSADDCYTDALREVLDKRDIIYELDRLELEPDRSCMNTSVLRNHKAIMKFQKLKYRIGVIDKYIKNIRYK